ncbi:MAG: FadD3 family acyl-CoA ligase [Polymorphobacter sp.]
MSNLPPTIPHAAEAAAARFGGAPAITEKGETWSFIQLWQHARTAASAFLAAGTGRGDRIAIWAPNRRDWIVAALGAHIAGAAIVPLNTRLKGSEAGDILRRARVSILCTIKDFLGTDYPALVAGEDLPNLRRTLCFDTQWPAFLATGSPDDLAVDAALAALTPEDVSDILFTSGTTGSPKGVISTHGRVIPMFSNWAGVVDLRAGDRYLIVNPFFHLFGYKAGWVASLLQGATIYPMPAFDTDTAMTHIERDRISFIPGPPTIYQSLLQSIASQPRDTSSLRVAVTGAATVPPILVERMLSELGFATVVTGYGMTECGTITMCRSGDPIDLIATSCGRAMPGLEVMTIADDGSPMAAGETGEILVRGYGVMAGYLDDPAATAEAIDADGWLHTGDVGVLDDAGYLRITDRKKDMYISGGFNCYPAEIEKLLARHPAIEMVAVIGVADDRMGEVGRAFVVPRPGHAPTEADIIAWARANIANYKVPRRVVITADLPRNAAGKVVKTELAKLEDPA